MAIYQCRLCDQLMGCTLTGKFRFCFNCDFFCGLCSLLMYPEHSGIKKSVCPSCLADGCKWRLAEPEQPKPKKRR